MPGEQEVRWEFDRVKVGQASQPTTREITEELISSYALAVRNSNPVYHTTKEGSARLAMPIMATYAARLRRADVASNNGFVALERASENARQTPFAKCEVRWFAPLRAGDSITSFSRVVDAYERRGNRFVTFRVEGTNQRGEKIAEYDYTCIFEYGKGQKKIEQPPAGGITPEYDPSPRFEPAGAEKAAPVTFASIGVGDELPAFTIGETQETIDSAGIADSANDSAAGEPRRPNIHTDPQFARAGIFSGTVNGGPTTMAYLNQMLERWFPVEAVYNGGRLLYKGIQPFRPGDTVTFTGQVTGKRDEDGRKTVDCELKGVNQLGQLMGVAEATLGFEE